MIVSGPSIDERKPGVPFVVKVRHGRTNSLVDFMRFPSLKMAEAAKQDVHENGLQGSGWPGTYGRNGRQPLAM